MLPTLVEMVKYKFLDYVSTTPSDRLSGRIPWAAPFFKRIPKDYEHKEFYSAS